MLPTHNSFERAPSMHTDLDFQSRLYSQVLRLHYPKAAGSGFVIEHIRRSPIGTTNSKGTWSPEECIITETAVYSERELTELWGETQDVAVDLVRCRLEKRWYRQDLKVGPHSCSTCFVRDVCIADVQGRLDAETLNMLTLERDPLALPDGHPLLDDTV